MILNLKQHKQEGDLAWEYNPLYNLVQKDGAITGFDVDSKDFNVDLQHPLNIECQPSYDGTVNLIINDDKNPPRIVNSRFTKIEGNKYRIINRNQKEQSNLYKIDKVDQQTRLFRTLNKIPKLSLYNVSYFGQLKGGNYVFYLKYADNDYNKTDFVAETGEITVFKGSLSNLKTISGTLVDERTDKSIKLKLSNIDTSFSKVYLYYSRSTSDLNGFRTKEYVELAEPYDITGDEMIITVNGFEDCNELTAEELNIQYNVVDSVKSQTQVQNRLFFANIETPMPDNTELQNISYYIQVQLSNEISSKEDNSIGYVDAEYKNLNSLTANNEYYSPQNIYYRLGYWPDEMYRLGVVYIMNNDTLTPVYNLRGKVFSGLNDVNFSTTEGEYSSLIKDEKINYIPKSDFLEEKSFTNTLGVFKNPRVEIFNDSESKPLYYKMTVGPELINELKNHHIKGFFFVRQKRIPTILGQGLEIGINKNSYIPMLYYNNEYIAESFKTSTNLLTTNINGRLLKTTAKQCSGLLSLDALVNPTLKDLFDGTEFVLFENYKTIPSRAGRNFKYLYNSEESASNPINGFTTKLNYIPTECPAKVIDSYVYSTKQGTDLSVSEFGWWNTPGRIEYRSKTPELVRGIYTGFIGTSSSLKPGSVYDIKINNYNVAFLKDYFQIRGNDNSSFFAISDRYSIYDELDSDGKVAIDVYRGDCYVNTVTIRINRNFIDPSVPTNDYIIDEDTWKKNYKGYYGAIYINGKDVAEPQVSALHRIAEAIKNGKTSDDSDERTAFYKINRADVNTVPLGMWVTYKCLSNYNLGLRSVDKTHADETALMGNPRGFYPHTGMSTKSAFKIPDSEILNDGYNSTVGERVNFKYADVPYIKDQFDNRIMFSNLQADDEFKNAYRIFESLCYQDIDRQYGAITKIYPWYANGNANLLCVFEHGIGIVPINEKALIQTTTGQNIHMYGSGVISPDVSILTDDFGSTWQDSIIKTPLAIYGVDTYAKKIWKVPLGGEEGISCISDVYIQQFLNDHITFKESDKTPIIALRNVKTHYNNYKGDVMFTFYDYEHNEEWNFCYNERQKCWITRYSWTPLASENINNCYYSFDKHRAEIISYIYDNKHCSFGLHTSGNNIDELLNGIELNLVGYEKLGAKPTITLTQLTKNYENNSEIIENFNDYLYIENNILYAKNELTSLIADYFLIEVKVEPEIELNDKITKLTPFSYTIGVINISKEDFLDNTSELGDSLRNGVYVHGRAGIYNELNYKDEDMTNNILPTFWYDKQEPFEFEFVVTQPTGLHKIFDNLVLISNNVQPNEFEFEVTGDVYDFNKAGLYWNEKNCTEEQKLNHEFDPNYNPIKRSFVENKEIEYQTSQEFYEDSKYSVSLDWDHVLNTYRLRVHQGTKNIKSPEYGRLQGNIHYKEDSWHLTIAPILYKTKYKLDGEIATDPNINSTRIRDKFCKIRVKYKGDKLAIITSLKTLITMSYA